MPSHAFAVPASSLFARLSPARQAMLLGLLAFLLCLIGAHGLAVVGFDSRFVLFAQEMLRHGPGAFPTTYGEPYPDYPATSTLFIYLLARPFGHVDSLLAWIPTALAAAVTVGLLYRLLQPYSTRWALLAVAMLLLTATFVSEARAVSLDQMVGAVALAAFYQAQVSGSPARAVSQAVLLGLLLLGFIIRGPLGLVVPAGVVCAAWFAQRRWRDLLVFGVLAGLLLVLGCVTLLGVAQAVGGADFARDVLHMQVIGRLDGSAGASEPWYYLTSAPGNYALAFPLAVPALLLLWQGTDDSARRLMRAALLAALVIGVGLSVPQAKKARYILPMAPFLAAVATYPFYVASSRMAGVLRGVMQWLWALLPGLLAVGVLLAWRRQPALAVLHGELLACLTLLLVLQGLALFAAWRASWRAGALAGCAVLALWTAYIGVYEPAERQLYDTRQFSQAADALIAAQPAPVAFVGLGRDAKAIKYLVNLDHDLQPSFIDGDGPLPALQGPLYLVMSAARLRSLAGTPIAELAPLLKASFDHEPYVLLYLPVSGAAQ